MATVYQEARIMSKVFMKQFAEIQSEIVTKIREIKETNNHFSISFDESTSTCNRKFINLNLHFPVWTSIVWLNSRERKHDDRKGN